MPPGTEVKHSVRQYGDNTVVHVQQHYAPHTNESTDITFYEWFEWCITDLNFCVIANNRYKNGFRLTYDPLGHPRVHTPPSEDLAGLEYSYVFADIYWLHTKNWITQEIYCGLFKIVDKDTVILVRGTRNNAPFYKNGMHGYMWTWHTQGVWGGEKPGCHSEMGSWWL